MKKQENMSVSAFAVSLIWQHLILAVWYNALLYRSLPGAGSIISKAVMVALNAVTAFLCVTALPYRNSVWTPIAAATLPYGLYTVLAYRSICRWLILAVAGAACILSVWFCIRLMKRRIRSKDADTRYKILRRRKKRCVQTVFNIQAAALLVIMICIKEGNLKDYSTLSASVKAEAMLEDRGVADTLDNNIEEVSKLMPEIWKNLSVQEKLDVLQTVCNIEAHYLGLTDPVTVIAEDMSPSRLGSYADELKRIFINVEHLENAASAEVLNTILHEIHHSHEYRLADVYESIAGDQQKLKMFRDAKYYAYERDSYIDGREDYNAYASQHLEMDSRTYAEYGVKEYFSRIEKWLEEQA